jgi:hypothetical protein
VFDLWQRIFPEGGGSTSHQVEACSTGYILTFKYT